MLSTEIEDLLKDYKDSTIINCLSYNSKSMKVMVENSLLSTGFDNLNNSMVYIIKNTYFADNVIFDIIFNYRRKNIYIINVSQKQEKYIYRKYKGKYKYFNCSFTKDNKHLQILKLMFLPENRISLLDEELPYPIKYILNLISYNLIDTDLKNKQLLKNYNLLLDLDKYCYKVNNKLILSLLATIFENPSYIPKFKYIPKKVQKDIKQKNKKSKKINIELLAKENMKNYFKMRNEKFFSNIKKNTKNKNNNIEELI